MFGTRPVRERTIILLSGGNTGTQTATLLEQNGFRVVTVSPGEGAAAALREAGAADLAIIDLDAGANVPGLAAVIGSEMDLPLLLLSGGSAPDVSDAALQAALSGIVAKDSAPAILIASIETAIGLHAALVKERARAAELERTQKELRESEEKYRFLAERMADIVWTLDLNLKTTYVSPSITRILGFTQEERLRQEVGEIMTPESLGRVAELFTSEANRVKSGKGDIDRPIVIEVEYYHKNGTTVWLENTVKPLLDEGGVLTGVYGVSRDISERKRWEASLSSALDEKGALLRELQHRVKNSLTMIGSLVNLEAERASGEETRNVLGELRGRINTLSNLYAMLFSGGSAREVRLDRYLGEIAHSLLDAFSLSSGRIELRASLEEITIDSRKASSFGLILYELVTNALKHAFPDGRAGTVEVILTREGGAIALEVRDDGAGMPPGFDMEKAGGLGLLLVNMLAGQLGGEVRLESERGTRFIVRGKSG